MIEAIVGGFVITLLLELAWASRPLWQVCWEFRHQDLAVYVMSLLAAWVGLTVGAACWVAVRLVLELS